jgi:hypothetical protein
VVIKRKDLIQPQQTNDIQKSHGKNASVSYNLGHCPFIYHQLKEKIMFDKFIQKLLTKSALRIVLSLALGIVVGFKIEGGEEVVCAIANALSVVVENCK